MEPSHGIISRTGNIIYFPQTALSDLLRNHGNETAIKYLEKDLTQTQARCHLGNFGLAKDLALREIHTLSAGQRVRLWLAKENLLHPSPCLLVFDEISENVDRETRDSLVKLLSEFEAAVLVISHDADFRGLFRPTKMWELRRFGLRETFAE
jgi:ATPase subunit of ABC transporter with duplicated ATPase domains